MKVETFNTIEILGRKKGIDKSTQITDSILQPSVLEPQNKIYVLDPDL
jgi:hypothetical protein